MSCQQGKRAASSMPMRKQLQEDAALIPLYHQVEVRMVKPDIIAIPTKDPLRNYTVKSWSFAPKK